MNLDSAFMVHNGFPQADLFTYASKYEEEIRVYQPMFEDLKDKLRKGTGRTSINDPRRHWKKWEIRKLEKLEDRT